MTVGLCVGETETRVPDCGVEWITTPPPVVLDRWPVKPLLPGPITSIGSWRGPWGILEADDMSLGQRVHSFRPLIDLPRRVPGAYELALDIDAADEADRALLTAAGWQLIDPKAVAADHAGYMGLIERSSAEICVAKEIYVRLRTGWFSDRSACYLAAGRPVLGLDTGFAHHLPTGEGLLAFSTLDAACEAVEMIRSDPRRHARAAREVAEEHLDARRVLGEILRKVAA